MVLSPHKVSGRYASDLPAHARMSYRPRIIEPVGQKRQFVPSEWGFGGWLPEEDSNL